MKFSGVRTATAGIIEKNGKVLLTKRSKMIAEGGKWCLPGGHVKKWETAEDCVKRELKEEVGLDVEKAKLLFVHEEFKKDLNLHAVVFVYSLKTKGKIKNNFEVKESRWFTKKEVEKLDMAFTHNQMLKRYWNGK
ncbi:hypothetical protein AUJ63_02245 [Candidatus Pacearchaeota archaeon CG1_02_35_32]|nr:MAG: hypothetical protein AUJ63_02245 [Candidatus Pacearchaeota archaeon CG1_02_35_32]